ncbi:MAG: hypothetical protein PHS02_03300 [Candidatus ainarchaeum sp.]|nr:hypothetical protein [Candidatus ainarchaeum sp.]
MTNITKSFKCSACSMDFPLSLNTDLLLTDFTMMAKCPKCDQSIQVHFGVIAQEQKPLAPAPQSSIDESIFVPPEMPSSEIKRLIEG